MKFTILKIKINNFRCIEHLENELYENTVIKGANECGKSTIANAIFWCLFGKSVENQSNIDVVPNGKYGEVNPEVEIECKIDDKPVTLYRQSQAKYNRQKEFDKYVTVCKINGIETGVRAFAEYITNNICNEQVFRILSNPKTFSEDCPKEAKELEWQAQRRLLMSILGESQTDLSVAYDKKAYAVLIGPLQRFDNASQYLSFLKKEYSTAQKSIDSVDAMIEQQKKNFVEVGCTEESLKEEVEKVRRVSVELEERNKHYIESANKELTDEIAEKRKENRAEREKYAKEYNELMELYNESKSEYEKKIEESKVRCDEAMKTMKTYAEGVDRLKQKEITEVCPTCGRSMPEDLIADQKNKLSARIKKGEKMLADVADKAAFYQKVYQDYTRKLNALLQPTMPHEMIELDEQYEKMIMWNPSNNYTGKMPGYEENKAELQSEMDKLKEQYGLINVNKQVQEKLDELIQGRKDTVKEMSHTQKMIDLCRKFISERCEQAEEQINALFEHVSFELFEKNKSNDEVKETCIMRYNGIKYQDLSYSTKIIANLEVVKAFQKFYNVIAPVVIDNAESVTSAIYWDGQLIQLKVAETRCKKCDGSEFSRRMKNGKFKCIDCGNEFELVPEIVDYAIDF